MSARVVLVTGATGAIGAPILDRLAGGGALTKTVALGHTSTVAASRDVTVLHGDIRRAHLGLPASVAADLARGVTDIVHMAADTRFAGPVDALAAANVGGLEQMIAFAGQCPRLERMLTLSTVYVAGRRTGGIRERELEHSDGFVNAYEQSKYEGEVRAREAMGRLPISVVRLSTVIGRAEDGMVSSPGAIHQALRFYYQSLAPMLPGTASSGVDVIPTEYAADAVGALLTRAFSPGATWHIAAAADAPSLEAFLDLTLDCFQRFRPSWRRRRIEKPAIVPLATFDRFADSVEELKDSVLSRCVAMVRPFAPQLAYPKVFDDRDARAALDAYGVARPRFETYYPRIVKHLIERWASAENAEIAEAEAAETTEIVPRREPS